MKKETIKYFSMFSGIGGFELGLENSKYEFENIGFSEIDKYATSIYTRHFPTHKPYGDATKINTEELNDFQLLLGGFPCQAFSIAGKRKGFNDTRGTLFFELARILKDKRPKYFLFENVRGLLSHDRGRTIETIFRVLNELRYDVSWAIYNSKDYGVPQNRERVFLKGYLANECGQKVLSQPNPSKETITELIRLNDKSQTQLVYDIDGLSCTLSTNGGGQGGKTGLYLMDDEFKENIEKNFTEIDENHLMTTTTDQNSYALTTRFRGTPLHKKIDNYVIDKPSLKIKNATKKGYDEAYPGDSVRLDFIDSTTGRGRVQKDMTGAVNCNPYWGTVDSDYHIRRLTPIECERLQGFPDGWTEFGKDGEKISDTQRYKCLGNAVTTNVITAIINEMFDGINNNDT